MRQIPLYRRKVVAGHALVDDADYEALSAHRWTLLVGKSTNYACRPEHIAGTANGTRMYYMHRVILGMAPGVGHRVQVDHVNRNGLDNRRANLRVVTPAENALNKGVSRNNKSGAVNVTYIPTARGPNKWAAHIMRNGIRILQKSFPTKEAAIAARDEALALYESKREQVSA